MVEALGNAASTKSEVEDAKTFGGITAICAIAYAVIYELIGTSSFVAYMILALILLGGAIALVRVVEHVWSHKLTLGHKCTANPITILRKIHPVGQSLIGAALGRILQLPCKTRADPDRKAVEALVRRR